MKKIGIVVDNYKLNKFKEELINQNLNDFKISPFIADKTSSIIVNVEDSKVDKVKKVCEKMEAYFNSRKSKYN